MQFLLFSSVLFVLCACSKNIQQSALVSLPEENECFRKAAPAFSTAIFQAGIDVAGKHISGLLVVKVMPDSSQRIVFANEVGVTFFDFRWSKTGVFKSLHCISKLNKRVVINTLRKDLELILIPKRKVVKGGLDSFTMQREKEVLKFKTNENCESIVSVEVMGKKSKLVDVVFFPIGKNVPDSVYLNHYNFKMSMMLKRIER